MKLRAVRRAPCWHEPHDGGFAPVVFPAGEVVELVAREGSMLCVSDGTHTGWVEEAFLEPAEGPPTAWERLVGPDILQDEEAP